MKDSEIRFSGSGGQGLITSARILANALIEEGLNVAQSQSYEPVSRGGLSRADLVISAGEAAYPLSSHLDFLLILDQAAAHASDALLGEGSLVLVDSELVRDPPQGVWRTLALPFTETAHRLGNKRVTNIVALSALVTLSGICTAEVLERATRARTPPKLARLNMEALVSGREMAMPLLARA
jgi:2-oxoglutarate ferredoxin oxidoreductase subunit gamma